LVEHADGQEPAGPDFTQSNAELFFAHLFRGEANAGGILPVHLTRTAHLPKRLDLMWQKYDLSALPEPGRLFSGDGQRRDVVQRGLKGNKGIVQRGLIAHLLEKWKGDCRGLGKRADTGAAEGGHMSFGTEGGGDVADKSPDIEAFSTRDADYGEVRRRAINELGGVQVNLT